jgi:hypothetical protein
MAKLFITTLAVWLVFAAPAFAIRENHGPLLPLVFTENSGSADRAVRFIGIGSGFKVLFTDAGVVLLDHHSQVRMSFVGRSRSQVSAENATAASISYFRGSEDSKWRSNLASYSRIRYSGLWSGIDVVYESQSGSVKSEYILSPSADIKRIHLRFDGQTSIKEDGSLEVGRLFSESKPFLYQEIRGGRVPIAGGFQRLEDGTIGFWVDDYDHNRALVIDPTIAFSGYFGGTSQDHITAVTTDNQGNTIVAGFTTSSDLPTSSGVYRQYKGSVDAFVASFNPNGGGLNFCTYLGGAGADESTGIAVDSSRNIYVTGWTSSSNFPVSGAYQPHLKGTRDAFVTKLSPSGGAVVYSTYLGGSGADMAYSITVDSVGGALITGDTTSVDLPVVTPIQAKLAGTQDAFVGRLTPLGNALSFFTYFGGSGIDHGSSIRVGPSGGIFVGGYTWSVDFPVLQANQPKSGGGQDGFLAKISYDGTALRFSTYLGGSGGSNAAPEAVSAICVDGVGNILVAGTTSSSNFPVTAGAFQPSIAGQSDGFVARFAVSGQLSQATFLGGAGIDQINALAVDFHGYPYVTGLSTSTDFPVRNAVQSSNAGGMDAFVVKLNNTLSGLIFGTYLGQAGDDSGTAIAVDGYTSVVVAGQTNSNSFAVAGSLRGVATEAISSFITKIVPSFTLGVSYPYQGSLAFVSDRWHVTSWLSTTSYGNATDIAVVGDWTGSGVKRIGVFRNGTWILDTNGNGILEPGLDATLNFGQAGDIPVVGDWRGTGRIALGLFRQGKFILDMSGHLSGVATGLTDAVLTFGQAGDVPVIADWSGSGTDKIGVFRNGLWLVDYNGDGLYNGWDQAYTYGQAGDIPVVGDWDSSGAQPKIGVYRNGIWILDYDGDHVWTTPYSTEMVVGLGFSGFTPLLF